MLQGVTTGAHAGWLPSGKYQMHANRHDGSIACVLHCQPVRGYLTSPLLKLLPKALRDSLKPALATASMPHDACYNILKPDRTYLTSPLLMLSPKALRESLKPALATASRRRLASVVVISCTLGWGIRSSLSGISLVSTLTVLT